MKIPIIYFSSSGNTKYICELVSQGLKSIRVDSELIEIEKIKKNKIKIENYDCIGIGSPIYGLNFVPIIYEWMESLPPTNNNNRFFLIDTMAGLPGGAIQEARKLLEHKGYRCIGCLEISVPTYDSVIWTDFFQKVSWNKNKIKRAYFFGRKIGYLIKKDKYAFIKEYSKFPLGVIASKLFKYLERIMYKYLTKVLSRNPYKCIKCRRCELACPVNAIDIEKDIFFDPEKCIFCFRCMRTCPKGALYFKLFPKAEFFKGPFQIKGYIPPEDINKYL
ncbi:MAG: EFR1 family ferrodoxin [Candidatus Helarchaeota archaeon]